MAKRGLSPYVRQIAYIQKYLVSFLEDNQRELETIQSKNIKQKIRSCLAALKETILFLESGKPKDLYDASEHILGIIETIDGIIKDYKKHPSTKYLARDPQYQDLKRFKEFLLGILETLDRKKMAA